MDAFINEVLAKLDGRISNEELLIIKNALSETLQGYDLTQKETALTVYNGGVPEEVKEYLVSKKIEGLTDMSLKAYLWQLKTFFEIVNKDPADVVTNDIRLYLLELKKKGISDITLNGYRRYINGFFEWLENNDYIQKNPCKRIKSIKCEKIIKEPLSEYEIELLRKNCMTLKEKAIVETLYSTGARVSELIGIKIDDINIEKKEIKIYGKGRKERIVYLNAKSLLALGDYIMSKGYVSEYVFSSDRNPHGQLTSRSVEMLISELGTRAGIKTRVYPHRIRRTTATVGLAKGMTLEQVQALLGHESPSTTLIYAKVSQDAVKAGHQKAII